MGLNKLAKQAGKSVVLTNFIDHLKQTDQNRFFFKHQFLLQNQFMIFTICITININE
jgi:hypothetical protein